MGKEPSKDLPGVRNSEQERVGDRNSSIISAASFHGQEGVEESRASLMPSGGRGD